MSVAVAASRKSTTTISLGKAGASRRVSESQQNIDHLWSEYKAAPSEAARDRLVEYYMTSHVKRIAERLHSQLPAQVDVDDLMQQGYVGLAESIERFEPARRVKFETFSGRRIYGSMRDYLRQLDHAPRLARRREKQWMHEVERFKVEHGRIPADDELCDRLEMTRERFRQAFSERPAAFVHFNSNRPDAPESDESDGMRSFVDHRDPEPSTRAEMDDLRRWVTTGFSRPDQLIIVLYYYEKLTMREIGRTLGISESRVSQRLDSIIKCLRARMSGTNSESQFEFCNR